jgi:hypothetical protein
VNYRLLCRHLEKPRRLNAGSDVVATATTAERHTTAPSTVVSVGGCKKMSIADMGIGYGTFNYTGYCFHACSALYLNDGSGPVLGLGQE